MTVTHATTRPAPAATSTLARLLEAQVGTALVVWCGFVVFVGAVTLAIAYWTDISTSVWQQAGIQAAGWYALAIGIHLGYEVMPLHITHGQTRREFGVQAGKFMLAFSAALAALNTAGFIVEAGLYGVAGWPRGLEDRHLYDSPWQLHLIFAESWLRLALWNAGGIFLGAAFYRDDKLGALAIIAAILIAGVAGTVFGSDWGPPPSWLFARFIAAAEAHPVIGVPLYLACITLVLTLTWLIVRDIPIRNRTS